MTTFSHILQDHPLFSKPIAAMVKNRSFVHLHKSRQKLQNSDLQDNFQCQQWYDSFYNFFSKSNTIILVADFLLLTILITSISKALQSLKHFIF